MHLSLVEVCSLIPIHKPRISCTISTKYEHQHATLRPNIPSAKVSYSIEEWFFSEGHCLSPP